jgi:hypothetical protein
LALVQPSSPTADLNADFALPNRPAIARLYTKD